MKKPLTSRVPLSPREGRKRCRSLQNSEGHFPSHQLRLLRLRERGRASAASGQTHLRFHTGAAEALAPPTYLRCACACAPQARAQGQRRLTPAEVAREDVLRRLTSAWRGVRWAPGEGEGLPVPRRQNFRRGRKTPLRRAFEWLRAARSRREVPRGPWPLQDVWSTTCPWRHGEFCGDWSSSVGRKRAGRSVRGRCPVTGQREHWVRCWAASLSPPPRSGRARGRLGKHRLSCPSCSFCPGIQRCLSISLITLFSWGPS